MPKEMEKEKTERMDKTENLTVDEEKAEAKPAEEPKTEDGQNPAENAEKAEEAASGGSTEKGKKEKKSDVRKLKSELEEAKKSLESEKKRADEMNDKYLRIAAEYDNFRKRSQKEKEAVYGDAVADTIKGILPIIDNLQYAEKYQNGDGEKFAEGVRLILSKVPETLEKLNIKQFGAVGEQFDPALHNAVMHEEDESRGENEIMDVLQCGYMLGDKVIRYAMVKVAN